MRTLCCCSQPLHSCIQERPKLRVLMNDADYLVPCVLPAFLGLSAANIQPKRCWPLAIAHPPTQHARSIRTSYICMSETTRLGSWPSIPLAVKGLAGTSPEDDKATRLAKQLSTVPSFARLDCQHQEVPAEAGLCLKHRGRPRSNVEKRVLCIPLPHF